MKIHEYQGKELFRKFGMATPRGYPCFSVDEAVEAAKKLGGKVWVVKAQIHAGGRGKGGGVKVAKSLDEVREKAKQILGMQLVTHQTGAGGCALGSWGGQRPSLGGYVTGTGPRVGRPRPEGANVGLCEAGWPWQVATRSLPLDVRSVSFTAGR